MSFSQRPAASSAVKVYNTNDFMRLRRFEMRCRTRKGFTKQIFSVPSPRLCVSAVNIEFSQYLLRRQNASTFCSTIMVRKPNMPEAALNRRCFSVARLSGIISLNTRKIIAPAAKPNAYGRIGRKARTAR
jgi:hypothetical protein